MTCTIITRKWLEGAALRISSSSSSSLLPRASSTSRSMGTWTKASPVRVKVITMDVTGTIVSFRGNLEEHYVGAAEKSGLPRDMLKPLEDPQTIHKAFGAAYQECCQLYPCFGGDDLTAKEWWRICVNRSFELAGVSMTEHQQDVVFQRIYSTFGSHAAYEKFADATPFLQWANRNKLVTGVLSNADERYGDSILPMLGITLDEVQFNCFSKDYKLEKPDSRFFHAAIKAAVPWLLSHEGYRDSKDRKYTSVADVDVDKICLPSEVLHIGNDFNKDFVGARRAGMHCVLLNRYGEDEKAAEWKRRGALVMTDLMDVVEFLGRSNCRLG